MILAFLTRFFGDCVTRRMCVVVCVSWTRVKERKGGGGGSSRVRSSAPRGPRSHGGARTRRAGAGAAAPRHKTNRFQNGSTVRAGVGGVRGIAREARPRGKDAPTMSIPYRATDAYMSVVRDAAGNVERQTKRVFITPRFYIGVFISLAV